MDKYKEKLLVLAPHPDDESLGCAGLIVRTIEEGGIVHVLVFTTNHNTCTYDEFIKASKILKISQPHFTDFVPLELDQVPQKTIISRIEEICRSYFHTTVAIPFINSFHQDHQAVAKAAVAALRPHGYISKRVLMYEQPFYGVWTINEIFKPNYYVDITKYLDKKMEALKCYKSQKIPLGMVEAMAKVRGAEVGVEYAESYQLIREVI